MQEHRASAGVADGLGAGGRMAASLAGLASFEGVWPALRVYVMKIRRPF